MNILISLCLFSSAFCLGLGLVLPLVRFEKLYFFSETPSLWQIISGLFSDGSWALGLLIFAVSVLFPVAKILALFQRAVADSYGDFAKTLSAFSKWSMLDVLLVAIVIFAAKTSGLATAITQPGVWFFAASTLFSAVGSTVLNRRDKSQAQQ